jgi:serine/threonine protein kinase
MMTRIHDQILPEGTQIGVYEIKYASKIGTFDITYRAWNHHLKGWVKIQEFFPHDFAIRTSDGLGVEPKSPNDKENFEYGLKAFLGQGEILTQIEHPNLAAAENILQINGTAYLIMDYQEGMPLSRLAGSSASFAETELKFILVSILHVLQKVHEHGIVHGGIQPATIFLGKDGEPLLTDFAAARLAIAAHTDKLAGELATGYAPAEQYERANEPGSATDFYALGATIYYCITHNQPVAAQNRIMALSKSEPDPMASLSGSPGTPYSAELLQAINWMLRPEYNDRPQSATEILALLKSEHTSDQAGSITSKQEAIDDAHSNPVAKNHVWIGVMAGIVALVTVGLWLGEKPSELFDDKPSTVTTQPLFQRNSGKTTVTPETKQADEEMPLRTSTGDNQAKNDLIAESASFSTGMPVNKPELKNEITTGLQSDTSQPLAVIDKSQPQSEKQNLPEKQADADSIKGYLVAAEKAMKAVHLTTPLKDNAYKYYQMVLASEPDNAEALAGLQKIVDLYIQFIEKARANSQLDTARLYLQRAESVLPDDPKLQSIRAELAAVKE